MSLSLSDMPCVPMVANENVLLFLSENQIFSSLGFVSF